MKTTTNGWTVKVVECFSFRGQEWQARAITPTGETRAVTAKKSERGAQKAAAEFVTVIEERGWI